MYCCMRCGSVREGITSITKGLVLLSIHELFIPNIN